MQTSASAPLLQGVRKAVRVSVIAMGAAPLAPKEPVQAADVTALTEEKVSCQLRPLTHVRALQLRITKSLTAAFATSGFFQAFLSGGHHSCKTIVTALCRAEQGLAACGSTIRGSGRMGSWVVPVPWGWDS